MTVRVGMPADAGVAALRYPALRRTLAIAATVLVAYALAASVPWALLDPSSVAVFYPPSGVTLAALVVKACSGAVLGRGVTGVSYPSPTLIAGGVSGGGCAQYAGVSFRA
ncbi:hypothetical protein ACL02O_06005 [Micromonospora sp. MS34]|uniref:hypothetical protein n=1 Tax=Micromonospora sp. MS34 TaxID=3385971 RepID=UPI00399F2BA8